MKNILRPQQTTLVLFGILSFLFLVLYVWHFSFAWEFGFGLIPHLVFLLIVLLIGFVLAVAFDAKQSTKFRFYFIISIIQLLFIWLISNPIREWQIENSKDNGVKIVELIDNYAEKNGTYPKSLIELENVTIIDFPKRTSIGTKYIYELLENENYSIGFKSYYGYNYYYDKDNKKWHSTD
ncbi:hypothetical protein [Maribacter sp.]|uniref:hypothetical protein n=1 Tax=Maribacter sp. TaxID=1897614 RepID=UPI0032994757